MREYSPLHPAVRIHGRAVKQTPLPLFWTGSGVEFVTDAASLALNFITDYNCREQWVSIEVDGTTLLRTPLSKGNSCLWIWQDMTSHSRHRVRLYKEVQPMPRDQQSLLYLCSITCDGALFPVPELPYKIEFIGDSLTAGEGLGGGSTVQDGVSLVFSTEHHYAVETAHRLNADFSILAQSGWGICAGWDNNPCHVMPRLYEQVCGTLPTLETAAAPYEFAAWQPDIIVVNLGNNDTFALQEPPFVDEAGASHKLHCLANGQPDKDASTMIAAAVQDFLLLLRHCNPHAQLVWAYGMLGTTVLSALQAGLQQYQAVSSETIPLVLLPETKPDQYGSNHHPGITAHDASAHVLTNALRPLLTKKENFL